MKILSKALVTVVAAAGMATAASAGVFVSATPGCASYCGPTPITYDFESNPPGFVLDSTSFVGPGSSDGLYAQPLGSEGVYFSVGPSTVTHNNVTIGNDIDNFSFIWGSVDLYNILTLQTLGGTYIFDGAAIAALIPGFADGNQTSPTSNPIVTFFLSGDDRQAVSFNMDSDTNAFEIDSIAVNAAVPEPGTWAMMLLGFGAIGVSIRRRRKVGLPQLA